MKRKSMAWRSLVLSAGVLLVSCASPLERTLEQQLREQMSATNQRYREVVAAGPVIELSRAKSDVEEKLDPKLREELDAMSGPEAYHGVALDLGMDLLGQADTPTVAMTLRRATRLAVAHNLDVAGARLIPAIHQTQVTQAQAFFDAVFFSNFEFSTLDTPTPPSVAAGIGAAFGSTQTQTYTLTTGIRKPLTTGGTITAQTQWARNERNPALFSLNPWWSSNIELTLAQPLLRNFGSDVNRAQIVLSRSLQRQGVEDLKAQLITTLVGTEAAYWNLVFSRQRLLIQMRLLERTIADRDQLEQRAGFDVTKVRITEANSFVELRRAEVIRARQQVRLASDALKRALNAPELSVGSETLIVPLDQPADVPVQFSLVDAVTTALRQRPELRKALLQISDATVRQRVADNLRLPQLDLAATLRYNGFGPELDDAYDRTTDADFIDYLLGLKFEVPIGNRGPEAQFQQRKLERRASVVTYRNLAQQVVLQVKNALRDLITAYELIGATRAARRAAADNLRAIEAQEQAGVALTPEFLLDLKLSTQQRLAEAETQEIQALVDYNTAIANFYSSLGTLLEYNGVEFQSDPPPGE